MTGMNAVLTCAEHARLDEAAAAAGAPVAALMEQAGARVAEAIKARWTPRATLVLCGPGDNGGDGYVVARELDRVGWRVGVAALGEPRPGSAAAAARAAWDGPVEPLAPETVPAILASAGLIVDALFGAGLTRPLDGAAAAAAEATRVARAGGSEVVAVDLPSGVSGDLGRPLGPAFVADLTVTFGRWKPAHLLQPARSLCGALVLADIGHPLSAFDAVSPTVFENAPSLWLQAWPWPGALAHKHARGRLGVVTGGPSTTGAARLAARAGLRIGAGLVTLLCPPSALLVVATQSTAVMTRSVKDDAELAEAVSPVQAVVIGPGVGVTDATRMNAAAALASPARVVLDADALTVFANDPAALFALMRGEAADGGGAPRCVLTPHAGEFARLFPDLDPNDDKLAAVREAAVRSGAVVLLKGADTVIAEPSGHVVVNVHASPFLATAGAGDVLAGAIGGLLAQGMPTTAAVAAASWAHGDAGLRLGPGLIAEDLCEALPMTLAALYHATGAGEGA